MRKFKCGFVSIVGRPNVGKSTLLNSLLKEKVSIISKVPQTTRYIIRGILNLKSTQIVFVDTPGIHLFKDRLTSSLNILALNALKDVEVILYVTDSTRPPHKEEEKIMNSLALRKTPLIMALNKIDKSEKYIPDYIEMWQRKTGGKKGSLKYFIPISALKGTGLDKIQEVIVESLPQSPPFYEKDTITDFPIFYRVSDVIREKICSLLKEELPHNIAVEVESIDNQGSLVKVQARILIAKKSHKLIVIGRRGSMIKEIGTLARKDLEDMFGKKVFLDLWVKLEKDWYNKPRVLKELGYTGI
ncbi:MAG: GTPase Era [Candidatus Omnitrophica bacterium]|nr:GTPase Era [Candidatus Omnitrophota bacterium]